MHYQYLLFDLQHAHACTSDDFAHAEHELERALPPPAAIEDHHVTQLLVKRHVVLGQRAEVGVKV
jgi:hypothetical protein